MNKPFIIMKNQTFLALLLIIISLNALGQHSSDDFFERLHKGKSQPDRGIFVNMKLGMTEIMNTSLTELDGDWAIDRDLGYSFNIGFNHRFRNLLAYGFGIGISSYSMNIASRGEITKIIPNQLDCSDDQSTAQRTYDAIMHYSSLRQNTKLTFIDIPVFIDFGNINYDRIGFYLNTGITASFPIFDHFSASGDYRQVGYYEYFDIYLPQLPGLFRFDDELYTGESHYELSPFVVSAHISLGITYPLLGGLILSVGPVFNHSVIDIAKPSNNSNIEYWNDFNHLLELDSQASKWFLGLEVRIQYSRGVFYR